MFHLGDEGFHHCVRFNGVAVGIIDLMEEGEAGAFCPMKLLSQVADFLLLFLMGFGWQLWLHLGVDFPPLEQVVPCWIGECVALVFAVAHMLYEESQGGVQPFCGWHLWCRQGVLELLLRPMVVVLGKFLPALL